MSIGFEDLMKLAGNDFKTCEAMEEHFPGDFAVRTAEYHIQQAIEKLLKAVILYNGESPAFTHDIGRLCDHCDKLGIVLDDNLCDIADTLTLWESKSRYDPYTSFSEKKYEMAKTAYNNTLLKLQQELSQVHKMDMNLGM